VAVTLYTTVWLTPVYDIGNDVALDVAPNDDSHDNDIARPPDPVYTSCRAKLLGEHGLITVGPTICNDGLGMPAGFRRTASVPDTDEE